MIQATRLRTEYMTDPCGIDIRNPRISWNVKDAVKQTAYALQIAVNEAGPMYVHVQDTDAMYHDLDIPLHSRDRVKWKVRLTDENGRVGSWSEDAYFEVGFLQLEDWKGTWITGNYDHDPNATVRYPADYFRKHFSVSGAVSKARLYISACGMYQTRINGKQIGDFVMAPGSTAFQRRAHYQVYDVTEYIGQENTWDITLADGFYASKAGVFGKGKTYGYEPKVIAQLEITSGDGSVQFISTDRSFQWSNDGPVRFADMKDGEIVDFRCKPSFENHAKETKYDGILCASNNVPVKEQEHLRQPIIHRSSDGNHVLDFGQNIAGYVQIKLCGATGHKCTMVFGEKLDEQGNLTQSNLNSKPYTQTHFQTIDLICDGEVVLYKPSFTVMGFQYVMLVNWPEEALPEYFEAIAVYSDLQNTHEFHCSDPIIQRIAKNTLWSVKGNFLDVPTDCPTRERAGWTGDAQLFATTAMFFFDCYPFFRKWLRDVTDVQHSNGMVYNINPSMPGGNRLYEWISMEGSCGWGDALITIPYDIWKYTGDDRLVREFWPSMERCLNFYLKRLGKRNFVSLFMPLPIGEHRKYISGIGRDFGEWTEPEDCAPSPISLLFPHPEEATAYIARSVRCMAEMAEHIDKTEQSKQYFRLFENIKNAYRHCFMKPKSLDTKRIARLARPILCEVCTDAERKALTDAMVGLNRERKYKIGTGFLSTRAFFEILTEAGYGSDAYKVITNPEIGWAQQIKLGATTVWENWTDDASLNHYSKGACCHWMFACLCGIQMDGKSNHFVIKPNILDEIDCISVTYESVYGKVTSSWTHMGNGIRVQVTIPENCTAELYLPGRNSETVMAGTYCFDL